MTKTHCLSKLSVMLTAAVIVLAGHNPVHASFVQLTSAQFATQTASLTVVTEDFEGFSGGFSSPFSISNGTYTGTTPFVLSDGTFCTDAVTNCLVSASTIFGDRSFSAFLSGTQFWGVDIHVLTTSDLFDITLTGNSGVLNLLGVNLGASGLNTFFGIQDTLGLISVLFNNQGSPGGGGGNYSFDNVRTAAAAAVPEPGTLTILAFGLAGMGFMTRRRRRAA